MLLYNIITFITITFILRQKELEKKTTFLLILSDGDLTINMVSVFVKPMLCRINSFVQMQYSSVQTITTFTGL